MLSEANEKKERKKIGLIYLYYYHENYKTASIEEKREIRKYYDKELRYKNAFYRDRKTFITFGHPSEWDERKVKRFVIHPEKPTFERGKGLFSIPFQMISENLIQINISKQTNIPLITVVDNYKHIHEDYKSQISKIIRRLKNLMRKIDTVNQTIKANLGKNYGVFNLGYLQIIFKIQINTIVRYIGIDYQPSKVIEYLSINKLQGFLRTLTGLESALRNEEGEIIGESNIFPDDFELTEATLIQIELNKRTNLMRAIREFDYYGCHIKVFELKSRLVMKE